MFDHARAELVRRAFKPESKVGTFWVRRNIRRLDLFDRRCKPTRVPKWYAFLESTGHDGKMIVLDLRVDHLDMRAWSSSSFQLNPHKEKKQVQKRVVVHGNSSKLIELSCSSIL